MSLVITSILSGIFALFMVLLSFQVSIRRAKLNNISYGGDVGDEILRRRIRAHGNFIEYAPLAIITVALIEYGGLNRFSLRGKTKVNGQWRLF